MRVWLEILQRYKKVLRMKYKSDSTIFATLFKNHNDQHIRKNIHFLLPDKYFITLSIGNTF